jgi:hypothetical protein
LLSLIYTGAAGGGAAAQRAGLQAAMHLLGITLPGFTFPDKLHPSILQGAKRGAGSKIEEAPAGKRGKVEEMPGAGKLPASTAASTKSSSTTVSNHPQYFLLQMTQALMPFEDAKELSCNMAGCRALVTPLTLTGHFQGHFLQHARQAAVVELACHQCDKKFRYRKGLEHHMRKAHGPPEEVVQVCRHCQRQVETDWHLPPARHGCLAQQPGGRGKATRKSPEEKASLACGLCAASVISEWYLPPSRHCCTGLGNGGGNQGGNSLI